MTQAELQLAKLKIWRDTRPDGSKIIEARIKQAAARAKAWAAINERKENGKS